MCSSAPCLVCVLGLVLYDLDKILHVNLYLYILEFAPSGVSTYSFYMENEPRESIFLDTKK